MDMSSLRAEQGAMNAQARERLQKMGRTTQVKNKSPALVQITAEQLLREAQEFKEQISAPPAQEITDPAELKEYQGRKRKEFEDGIRRNQHNMGLWMRYAAWEAKLGDFARARSVFERALDVDPRNQSMWLRYAEMEMRNRQIAHARNIWDRAVGLLPRVDQFWYKYAYMEEMMGEVAQARQIFERWMSFHPNEQAWLSFIKLEIRHQHIDRARALYERFTLDHLTLDSYLKYAKFEMRYGTPALARRVFERIGEELLEEERSDEKYYMAFAAFEERNKEYERARAIYQFALDHVPKHRARELYEQYVSFEKSYGDREGIEMVILSKKRFQYEEEIRESAAKAGTGATHNYDIWFDYLRLEQDRLDSVRESLNDAVRTPANIGVQCARVRELFERAVANVPLVLTEKKYWKRYIYIWINWLLFEELTMQDVDRTRTLFLKLLGNDLIPHGHFSFAKLWLSYAHFEVRQGNLQAARMKLGEALGRVGAVNTKTKLFQGYLALELQLGALDRVRKLYEKFVEFAPQSSQTWIDFAAFEARLSEGERARGIFELAIAQPALDQPERVWKSYIELESAAGNHAQVRALYTRLLDKTKHVKVWIAYAHFEAQHRQLEAARAIFARGEEYFKVAQQRMVEEEASSAGGQHMMGQIGVHASPQLLQLKEERLLLLQSWRELERTHGDAASLQSVVARLPQQLKKRRPVYVAGMEGDLSAQSGLEEYFDYVFPEESAKAAAAGGSKFLEMAKMWKRQKEEQLAREQARLEAEVDREEEEQQARSQEESDEARMQEGEVQLDEDEEEAPGSATEPAAAPAAADDDGVQPMEQ